LIVNYGFNIGCQCEYVINVF